MQQVEDVDGADDGGHLAHGAGPHDRHRRAVETAGPIGLVGGSRGRVGDHPLGADGVLECSEEIVGHRRTDSHTGLSAAPIGVVEQGVHMGV